MSIVYNVESPAEQASPDYGIIRTEGWIFSPEGTRTEVQIRFGGRKIVPKQNLPRADVRDAYPEEVRPYAYLSGFTHSISLSGKEKGRRLVLEIVAVEGKERKKTLLRRCLIDPAVSGTADPSSRTLPRHLKGLLKCAGGYLKRNGFPKTPALWGKGIRQAMQLLRYGDAGKPAGTEMPGNMPDDYEIWRLKNEPDERLLEEKRKDAERMKEPPFFSVIMPVYNTDPAYLREAVDSVRRQIYGRWELSVADDCSPDPVIGDILREFEASDTRIRVSRTERNLHISGASNLAVRKSSGEYLVMLDHDDLLAPDTLYELAKVILAFPDTDILYSDDDKAGPDGNLYDPQFKPDWSPELLLSYMYFSHVFAIRRTLFDRAGGFRTGYEGSQDHDLALRAAELTDRIRHIPKVLYHWRASASSTAGCASSKPYSIDAGLRAVRDALWRRGISAEVFQPAFAKKNNLGIYALRYTGACPAVSIVIPSRNRRELLQRCIESIEKKTRWPDYEIIIVDDGSYEPEALQYLESLRHTVLHMPAAEPAPQKPAGGFNFSRLVNAGVEQAHSEYVILLNNDTEVIEPDWIGYLFVYMQIEGVGAVGAKLIYGDRRIQHAGVILRMGNGIAGHAFKLLPETSGGYLSYAKVGRNYSAVTAACLMTDKTTWQAAGGFDEQVFAGSYNDADFCMKIRRLGKRIVYSPNALLYHHEGATRGTETDGRYADPEEEYRFFRRWIGSGEYQDPFYSRNLSYDTEDFRIACDRSRTDVPKSLKVLLLTHNLNCEGAPLVQYEIAAALAGNRYAFSVFSMEDGLLRECYEKQGIPVCVKEIGSLRQSSGLSGFRKTLKGILSDPAWAGTDLIYANTLDCFFGTAAGEILHCPAILAIHESVDYHAYFSEFGEEYVREFARSVKKAVRVLFVSKATAALYRDLCTHNFTVIRNGIDLNETEARIRAGGRDTLRREMAISEDAFAAAVIGTVCERKGQLIFLKAARLLRSMRPERKLIFLIVGARESSYLDMIRTYIREHGLSGSVRIIPYTAHEKIHAYYRVSDVFVCSSFEESSPLVLLEAAAFGLPVVSTNVFGIPEILRDGQDAILVPPGREQDLAEGMLQIMDHPDTARRMAESALLRVKTFFRKDEMIRQYDSLMQSAVQEGANRFYEKYCR